MVGPRLCWQVLLLAVILATWRFSAFAAPKVGDIDKVFQDRSAAATTTVEKDAGPSLPRGEVLTGKIKTIKDTGVVIHTKKGDGFAHISQLSDNYVGHPAELFDENDEVTARVFRHENGFLELTLKEIGTQKLKDFKVNQELNGTVTAVCGAGADVEVGAEQTAFLHVSCIQDDFLMDARERLQKGDKIKVWVKKVDYKGMKVTMVESQREKKTIAKGLKLSNLSPGDELGGEVTGVKHFGAFIDVGAEEDGLLQVRQINNGLVRDLPKILRKGDKLVVKVKGFARKKLNLELVDTLPRLPKVDGFLQYLDEPLDATIFRQISPTSYLVEIPIPESSEPPVVAYLRDDWTQGEELKEGDMVTILVSEVDVKKRQVTVEREPPQAPKKRRR
eukprot:symbB.v1.2.031507.t1/scaffold3660.1/size123177/3